MAKAFGVSFTFCDGFFFFFFEAKFWSLLLLLPLPFSPMGFITQGARETRDARCVVRKNAATPWEGQPPYRTALHPRGMCSSCIYYTTPTILAGRAGCGKWRNSMEHKIHASFADAFPDFGLLEIPNADFTPLTVATVIL